MRSFSAGYFEKTMQIEEYNEDKVLIPQDLLETICQNTDRMDEPAAVKLSQLHYPVYGDGTLPHGTIAFPREIVHELEDRPPTRESVLIPKRQRQADRILWSSSH